MQRSRNRRVPGAMKWLGVLVVAFGATACQSEQPTLPDPVDRAAPTVLSVSPADGQAGVSPFSSVTVTFSERMAEASLNSSSITLRASGLSVDAATSVTYDAAAKRVTITPDSPLYRNAPYTLTVTTEVRDAAGNALTSNVVSAFRIIDSDLIPPHVVWLAPVHGSEGVSTNSRIAMRFSEPVNPATLVEANIRLASTAGNTVVPASFSVLPGSHTVVLTPTAPLSALTNYTVTVGTGVRDGAGNGLASQVVAAFATGGGPDLTPPAVVSRNPAHGQTGVALNAFSADVTFSRPMDPTTVNASGFALSPAVGSNYEVSLVAPTVARVYWASQLVSNTTYTIEVTPGARDLAGNAVAAPSSGTFTALRDTVPPTVVATHPATNATGVPRDLWIRITFSEEFEGVGWDDIIVTVSGSPVTRTGTGNGAGPEGHFVTAKFTLFAPNTLHTVRVRGARDKAGNSMAADYVFAFTTGQ